MNDYVRSEQINRLVEVLEKYKVDYMFVGGVAATIYGSERLTEDLDIMARDKPDNHERLAAALNEIGAFSDIAEKAEVYELWGMNTRWETDIGVVDVLISSKPDGDRRFNWATLSPSMQLHTSPDSVEIKVTAIEDLIAMKSTVGREKDLETVEELLNITNRNS